MEVVAACVGIEIEDFAGKVKTRAKARLKGFAINLVKAHSTGSNYATLVAHIAPDVETPGFKRRRELLWSKSRKVPHKHRDDFAWQELSNQDEKAGLERAALATGILSDFFPEGCYPFGELLNRHGGFEIYGEPDLGAVGKGLDAFAAEPKAKRALYPPICKIEIPKFALCKAAVDVGGELDIL